MVDTTEDQLKRIGELEGTIHSLNEQIKTLTEDREKFMKENEEIRKTLDLHLQKERERIVAEIHSLNPDFKEDKYTLDQLMAYNEGLKVSKKKKTVDPVPERHSTDQVNEKLTMAKALWGGK